MFGKLIDIDSDICVFEQVKLVTVFGKKSRAKSRPFICVVHPGCTRPRFVKEVVLRTDLLDDCVPFELFRLPLLLPAQSTLFGVSPVRTLNHGFVSIAYGFAGYRVHSK